MANELALLRGLVDLRDRQIQKARIQFGNRVDAIVRGADASNGRQLELAHKWAIRFNELEDELDKDIAQTVEKVEIFEYMSAVKGISHMISAKLIAMIDIERSPRISNLWRYAGYGQGRYWKHEDKIVAPLKGKKYIDGDWQEVITEPKHGWELVTVRDRPIKGWQIPYNKRLKTACYLASTSFLKARSPYRYLVYDQARDHYEITHPEWTKDHKHKAAMRKMSKMFLSHLWLTWRQLEGLPTSLPYAHEHLGHQQIITPAECGWPVVSEAKAVTIVQPV